MLEAIAQARTSVSLLTYIFDRDKVGIAFARALGEATRRGVEVRVLIDAGHTLFLPPSSTPCAVKASVMPGSCPSTGSGAFWQ